MIYFLTDRKFAFIATITVLSDVSAAPSAGVISIPCGYSTPAANGIANMLYPVAQNKFCTILL